MRKISHNVELDPFLKEAIADFSRRTGKPQNALIREAIRDYLEKQGYREKVAPSPPAPTP